MVMWNLHLAEYLLPITCLTLVCSGIVIAIYTTKLNFSLTIRYVYV